MRILQVRQRLSRVSFDELLSMSTSFWKMFPNGRRRTPRETQALGRSRAVVRLVHRFARIGEVDERREKRKRWGDRVPSCVLFIGLPASGKSTFFKARFVDTHIRINRDMLRTAPREKLLISACLEGGTNFVLDKTNVLRAERAVPIELALQAGFVVQGYFFESRKDACIARNASRAAHERVPDAAILGMRAKLELPSRAEGFDELYFVKIVDGQTIVEEYRE